MSHNQENSIKTQNLTYQFSSKFPLERQIELRNLLCNYSENWGILFITLYPSEIKKVLNKFPEFQINVLNKQNSDYTIFCKIYRTLH